MPTNNTFIMMGLGMAALWFMNRGGSEDDQVDQLAGAAMMASGEGTAPNAPFEAYSAPANPSFFFNEGGQMTKVPGAPVPFDATSGEDIGRYPGGGDQPELEFEIERSDPPIGTTDPSPTTPEFAGFGNDTFITSTIWENQAAIAVANEMPLLAVQTEGGTISVLGSNVDISNLSSGEGFRAINVGTGDVFTSDRATVAAAIEQGYFTPPTTGPYVPKPWQQIEAEWRERTGASASASDEDIGAYPGRTNPPELEFTIARGIPTAGTSDISPINPLFAGTAEINITPATIWDTEPQQRPSPFLGVQPAVSRGDFFALEGGAFGPTAFETIQSTFRPEPIEDLRADMSFRSSTSVPAWAGGNNWWDEG